MLATSTVEVAYRNSLRLLRFARFHFHNFAYSGLSTSILGGRALWEVPLQTIKLFGATEILMMTVGVLLITALTFLL